MHKFKRLRQFIKVILMLAAMGAAFSAAPAGADRLRINPVPPHVVPVWTPMPDLPEVYHAPNIPTDVFRHLGRYYFYWEGVWYKSKNTKGPWARLQQPPSILFRIQPAYFKPVPRAGGQPPGGAPPGVPPGAPPGEGLITPEGRPAMPPPPTVPGPTAPFPPSPPQVTPPPEPPATPQPPETQPPEPAPPAAPEAPMPKAM